MKPRAAVGLHKPCVIEPRTAELASSWLDFWRGIGDLRGFPVRYRLRMLAGPVWKCAT